MDECGRFFLLGMATGVGIVIWCYFWEAVTGRSIKDWNKIGR